MAFEFGIKQFFHCLPKRQFCSHIFRIARLLAALVTELGTAAQDPGPDQSFVDGFIGVHHGLTSKDIVHAVNQHVGFEPFRRRQDHVGIC